MKNNKGMSTIFLFLCISCSSMSEPPMTVIDFPPELQEAQVLLKSNKPERAEHEVQKYMGTTRDVYWQGQAYLLLGEIRESTGKENLAIDSYRQAVNHGAGYHSAVAAQGLYRMSWIYERTLQYNDLQIVLMDLLNVLGSGDNFIKLIETPARLANTYYVLGKWERALDERKKITPELFTKYKSLAKDEKNLFQAKMYLAFQGMKPISITPYKSQQIITDSRRELLDVGEMGTSELAQRAIEALEGEYKRYFSQLKILEPTQNPVQTIERNKVKIHELAVFVDEINELRVLRRPPELIVNKQLNVDFFRSLQILEQEARSLVHGLAYGVQRAQREKNPQEKNVDKQFQKNTKPVNQAL